VGGNREGGLLEKDWEGARGIMKEGNKRDTIEIERVG
jgi:hypothetical protein